jgi:DNA polymerase-1
MANESRDPNKLAVFEKGIDGHCLNAYAYFKEDMPDITEKLKYLDTDSEFVKVTFDDGSVEYFAKSDPKLQEVLNES